MREYDFRYKNVKYLQQNNLEAFCLMSTFVT